MTAFTNPTTDSRSDAELLSRFSDGDASAYEELVERHAPFIHRVATSILRDRALAEDATQETFVTLLRCAHSLRNTDVLRAWLGKTAANHCRNLLRSSRRRRRHEEARAQETLETSMEAPPGEHDAIREAVMDLPGSLRAPVLLKYFEGLPQIEIAEILGLSSVSISRRLRDARERLRRRLVASGYAPTFSVEPLLVAPALRAALWTDPSPELMARLKLLPSTARSDIGTGAGSLQGSMAPRSAAGIALAALLLGATSLGVLAVVWATGADPRPTAPVATPDRRPEPGRSSAQAEKSVTIAAGDAATEQAPDREAAPTVAYLEGFVLDEQGPATGLVQFWAAGAPPDSRPPSTEAKADGTWRLEIPAGTPGHVTINGNVAGGIGAPRAPLRGPEIRALEPGETHTAEYRLSPAWNLCIKLQFPAESESSHPSTIDAALLLDGREVRRESLFEDADSWYWMTLIDSVTLPHERTELLVETPGDEPRRLSLAGMAPQPDPWGGRTPVLTATVRYGGRSSFAGVLRTRDGDPVPARLLVREAGETDRAPGQVEVDARGRYEVTGLSAGDYVLYAASSTHVLAEPLRVHLDEGEAKTIDLYLEPGRRLLGRVAAPDGTPLHPGLRLRFERGIDRCFAPEDWAHTDRFELAGLPLHLDDLELKIDCSGRETLRVLDHVVLSSEEGRLELFITLEVSAIPRDQGAGAVAWDRARTLAITFPGR